MNTHAKFAVLIVLIIGTLVWLAIGGIQQTNSYYKTVAELHTMGDDVYAKRLRVAGDVAEGSIQRSGRQVRFTLKQEATALNVVYDSIDPLPDTFRDGAQAVCHGKMGRDGVFHATRIEAKCASKYEAKPGEKAAPAQQRSSL
jgi:cytochrome c-type biogenesis protein CcmE